MSGSFIAVTLVLSLVILTITLNMRATRGSRIKDKQRGLEKMSVWKIGGMKFHFHHSYIGIILLPIGFVHLGLLILPLSLIASDMAFHVVAHIKWGDPWWD